MYIGPTRASRPARPRSPTGHSPSRKGSRSVADALNRRSIRNRCGLLCLCVRVNASAHDRPRDGAGRTSPFVAPCIAGRTPAAFGAPRARRRERCCRNRPISGVPAAAAGIALILRPPRRRRAHWRRSGPPAPAGAELDRVVAATCPEGRQVLRLGEYRAGATRPSTCSDASAALSPRDNVAREAAWIRSRGACSTVVPNVRRSARNRADHVVRDPNS
jgi:hypothetical protein